MNLNFGSQDFATVREVQVKLREKGFYKLKICSGLYLNETFDAVKSFQKKNKLPLTGIVDERTFKMIMA